MYSFSVPIGTAHLIARGFNLWNYQLQYEMAKSQRDDFQLKVIPRVRWRKAGKKDLKLIIIRPVAYRPTKNSRLLYREPAYLICTDPDMDLAVLLQAYLWRWEIEVNFKDEKTIMGCGQAQVRTKEACTKAPAFVAATYSLLMLASQIAKSQVLPRPKWYKMKKSVRVTTGEILN